MRAVRCRDGQPYVAEVPRPEGEGVVVRVASAGICGSEHVGALHVNYGLREDAGSDEAFCRELCERLGIALDSERSHGLKYEPT